MNSHFHERLLPPKMKNTELDPSYISTGKDLNPKSSIINFKHEKGTGDDFFNPIHERNDSWKNFDINRGDTLIESGMQWIEENVHAITGLTGEIPRSLLFFDFNSVIKKLNEKDKIIDSKKKKIRKLKQRIKQLDINFTRDELVGMLMETIELQDEDNE
ncbi:MAG: hypothetical protein ACTSYS_09690 [Promethearchaeota archaeon]